MIDQPSSRWMISASANRLTPEIRTVAIANVPALNAWVALVEAQAQVLGDRADLGAVVERHHQDAEEDHRRDGADPVVVHGGDAVLGAVGGLSQDLERAQVGGDEREAGDPRRQRATRQEEVEVGLDGQARDEPDPQDDHEVDREDHIVDRRRDEASAFRTLSSWRACYPLKRALCHPSARSEPKRRFQSGSRSPDAENAVDPSPYRRRLACPVRIRSPGAQRARLRDERHELRRSRTRGRRCWLLAQLAVDPGAQARLPASGTSSAVVTHGPNGQKVSAPLARVHCGACPRPRRLCSSAIGFRRLRDR